MTVSYFPYFQLFFERGKEMTKKMRITAWFFCLGCVMFFIYGILVAIFNEAVAANQYQAFSGESFETMEEEARAFISSSFIVIGLMGAGLSICSGVLFWRGLSLRVRWVFLLGLIGGILGVASLINIHFSQKAWFLFIVDNICLTFINLGFIIGGKELLDFFRGKPEGKERIGAGSE